MSNLGTINIGDRLYNYAAGKYIEVIENLEFGMYKVKSLSGNITEYCIDKYGYTYNLCEYGGIKSKNQVIFWDKPEIIAPSKPKPKKEHFINQDRIYGVFWGNHLQVDNGKWLIFDNEKDAQDACHRLGVKTYVGEVKISYMIEE